METRKDLEDAVDFTRAELEALPDYGVLKLRMFSGKPGGPERSWMPFAIDPRDVVNLIHYLEAGLREYDRLAGLDASRRDN